MADRLAVLGSPIEHSRSPQLHRAAYAVLGLDWQYEAIEVPEQGLAHFLDGLDASWRGLSLTMPLKRAVVALVDTASELVTLTGVANTVLLAEGRRSAFNTDVDGIRRALAASGLTAIEGMVILGGGATAVSALVAAQRSGAARVAVVLRDPAKAGELVELGDRLGVSVTRHRLGAFTPEFLPELVVNTIPAAAVGELPHPAELHSALLFEASYEPWPTPLARLWAEAGSTVVPGIDMLIEQALLQVRIFVAGDPDHPLADEPAVLGAMRHAVGRSLATPWSPPQAT